MDIVEISICRSDEYCDWEYRERITVTEIKKMKSNELQLYLLNCLRKVLVFNGKRKIKV